MHFLDTLSKFTADDMPPRVIIRVDFTGGDLGAAPYDILRAEFQDIESVVVLAAGAGKAPFDKRLYKNKRTELFCDASVYGRDGYLDITRIDHRSYGRLLVQLPTPNYEYNLIGQRILMSKDKMREILGRSPDDADAFNLAYSRRDAHRLETSTESDLHKVSKWAGQGGRDSSRWDAGSGDEARRGRWRL